MRILITGSRDWEDKDAILAALRHHNPRVNDAPTIVHGACPTGADFLADQLAQEYRACVERHPAEWAVFGKRAGFVRNSAMVELGADICLAFIRNGSRGATMTADLAEAAGIPTFRYIS